MTFFAVMGAIIAIAGGISAWFFRKGGIYNPVSDPVEPPVTPENATPSPVETPPAPLPLYDWSTPQKARHSVRVICDEEGLTFEQKTTLCATIGGESGWRPDAVGKPNNDGTRDYGICQINTYWWIGEGKQFPSIEYVLENPEACVRWMCTQWKAGHRNWWIAYKNGRYLKFL